MISVRKLIANLTLDRVLILGGAIALIFIFAFFVWWLGGDGIEINNDGDSTVIGNNLPRSSISGINCENADNRPIAVMLASDPIARPLSGISQAEIVFEMPVTPSGLTRIMAVYQCENPREIGSVRSAREDFIPLAAGLGAVYAHWGGEKEALAKLDGHIIDNIDAMKYENVYFYRKKGIPQPHNGFTDLERLTRGAQDLKYSSANTFPGYIHSDKELPKNILNLAESVSIDHPRPFDVTWSYDNNSRIYKRYRSGEPEIDSDNGAHVTAATVIVMETTSKFSNKDYLSVAVTGSGQATIYRQGIKISGRWQKDPEQLASKLFFYDTDGKEVEFMPGKVWVEIITRN